jgi:hypothetical protein
MKKLPKEFSQFPSKTAQGSTLGSFKECIAGISYCHEHPSWGGVGLALYRA